MLAFLQEFDEIRLQTKKISKKKLIFKSKIYLMSPQILGTTNFQNYVKTEFFCEL